MPKQKFQPCAKQIIAAGKDVSWEYLSLHLAALEMTKGLRHPLNHLVEHAFLVHFRSLAEFFSGGVDEFRQGTALSLPLARSEDDIYAVDFCSKVLWCEKHFSGGTKLIKAINKTRSHMTYSRRLDSDSEIDVVFVGDHDLHGTVKLMRHTWEKFLQSISPNYLRPTCSEDIQYWIDRHTEKWEQKLPEIQDEFENWCQKEARERPDSFLLNQTPDGLVSFQPT